MALHSVGSAIPCVDDLAATIDDVAILTAVRFPVNGKWCLVFELHFPPGGSYSVFVTLSSGKRCEVELGEVEPGIFCSGIRDIHGVMPGEPLELELMRNGRSCSDDLRLIGGEVFRRWRV